MASVADLVLERGIYIGRLTVRGSIMDFQPAFTRSEYRHMGDMVYFMYVDGKLMKIGKAGGKDGWYGRVQLYKRGRRGDATNNRIMDVMESLQKSDIEVYAILSPRESIKLTCPLTDSISLCEIETHRDLEKKLTNMYMNETPARDLPFCNQLN